MAVTMATTSSVKRIPASSTSIGSLSPLASIASAKAVALAKTKANVSLRCHSFGYSPEFGDFEMVKNICAGCLELDI